MTAGTLEIGPDGRPVRLMGTLDPASIDTGNPRRDRDLRGPRFLAVAGHPAMTLLAERFEAAPTGTGWRADAVLHVAGHDAPLRLDGTIEEQPATGNLLVTGTGRLHLPDAGIRPPRILVGHLVELTVTATLRR